MTAAACKAAICDDKAESGSQDIADIPNILKDEPEEMRIKVSEFIIASNDKIVEGVIKLLSGE